MGKHASTPTTLEIYLLGPFRIFVDGQAIEERQFTRRKPKQLIKLLALQTHHQLHRDQAMEFLWPDSDPESAANNLHKAIHMARHALEPSLKSVADSHFILTHGQQVLLCAPVRLWVDVEEFEQRVKAAKAGRDIKACEEARSLFDELLAEDRTAITLALLGHVYATSGKKADALKVLAELNELSKRSYVSSYRLGAVYESLEEKEQAFECLQRAYEERDPWLAWLELDPCWTIFALTRALQTSCVALDCRRLLISVSSFK